jgi:hypothetical protein
MSRTPARAYERHTLQNLAGMGRKLSLTDPSDQQRWDSELAAAERLLALPMNDDAELQAKDTEIERLKKRVQELQGFLESIRDFDDPYIDKTHTIQLMISLAKRAIQTALKEDQ